MIRTFRPDPDRKQEGYLLPTDIMAGLEREKSLASAKIRN